MGIQSGLTECVSLKENTGLPSKVRAVSNDREAVTNDRHTSNDK